MLPLVIELGSIIVGKVIANEVSKLWKKDQEVVMGIIKQFIEGFILYVILREFLKVF